MNKDHPYFSDVEPDNVDTLLDWVPSGKLGFTNTKISNSTILCFKEHEKLILGLIEYPPDEPITLYPMDSHLFNQFAYDDRRACILEPRLSFAHEELVLVISINPNGYPTGEWFEAVVKFQDYYHDPKHPALDKGWHLIVLEKENEPHQVPNACFIPQ